MQMFPQEDQTHSSRHHRSWWVLRMLPLPFLLIITLLFAGAGIFSAYGIQKAHADTAWTLVWSDDFNGAAGTGVDPAN